MVTFLYGCGATFAGVFIIAWSTPDDEDTDSDTQSSEPPEAPTPRPGTPLDQGTLGRRKRVTLILHNTPTTNSGSLRHKPSAVGLMALSSAQVSPGQAERTESDSFESHFCWCTLLLAMFLFKMLSEIWRRLFHQSDGGCRCGVPRRTEMAAEAMVKGGDSRGKAVCWDILGEGQLEVWAA
jgi:hypothetical protein